MSQELRVNISGLYSYPSDLSAVPQGALTQAQNVILDKDSVAEPRRGFDYLTYAIGDGTVVQATFPLSTDRAQKYFFFQNQAIAQYRLDKLACFGNGGWSTFSGSYAPISNTATGNLTEGSNQITGMSAISGVANGGTGLVVGQLVYGDGVPNGSYVISFNDSQVFLNQPVTASGSGVALTFVVAKTHSAQAAQNLYLTTNLGVRKMTEWNSTPTLAGVPQALDVDVYPEVDLTVSASPGWIAGDTSLHVVSTAGIGVGMTAIGTGLATGSVVTHVASNYITISKAATGTGSSVTLSAATWVVGSTGATYDSVNYRVVWNITDVHNNLITGAPSSYVTAKNLTGAPCSFNVTFTIPDGITTNHTYQLYRSFPTTTTTTIFVPPNDDEYLVYEGMPSADEISLGTITICDVVPDDQFGAEIYTAQAQEGAAMANLPLPQAQDIAVFRDCMFYANTQNLQSVLITLTLSEEQGGLSQGDTVTIAGVTYTAANAENYSAAEFQISSSVDFNDTWTTTSTSDTLTLGSTLSNAYAVGETITGTNIPTNTFVVSFTATTVKMSRAATGTGSVSLRFTGQSAGSPITGDAEAINLTVQSLGRVINRYSGSNVTAQYLTVPGTTPGQLLLIAKGYDNTGFTVTSTASSWTPTTVGTTGAPSSSNIAKNGLWYSKQNQFESVPLPYFTPVGSANANILRIVPLRDSLIIQKEDGAFVLQGDSPDNFVIRPLDYTSILLAPESSVLINNQVMCLTNQGVVSITETGVSILSHPVEGGLLELMGDALPALKALSFGVSYETDRAYYLFLPTTANSSYSSQYLRWNYFNQLWTAGALSKTCGGINPATNTMWLGPANSDITDVERKSYTYSDYADYKSTQTFTTADGKTLTNVTDVDTINVGDVFWQSDVVWGIVESVDVATDTVVLALTTELVSGSADVLGGIPVLMTWAPVTLNNPGYTKQIWEGSLLFLAGFQGPGTVLFSTDLSQNEGEETLSGGAVGPWGLFAWGGPQDLIDGSVPNVLGAYWGGNPARGAVRFSVGRNWQRCSQFTMSFEHSYAYSPWKLQGFSLIGNMVSERIKN